MRPPVAVVVAVVAALVVSMFGSTIVASPPSGAATAAGPSTYVPVQQTRVFDSGGQVAGGGVVAVPITGSYGVPGTGTTSVLVSITVLGSSGNVVAYPADEAAPGVANVQKVANQAVNNAAIVRVSTAASGGAPGGSIDVLNQGDGARIIVDLQGYFTNASSGGGFMPLNPLRLVDTRVGTGAARGQVQPGTALVVNPAGPVPPGATAVVVNISVVHPVANGYAVAYPFQPSAAPGAGYPPTATVNFQVNQDVDNLAQVQLGSDGRFQIYVAGSATDVVVDLQGYYTSNGPSDTFTPVTGARLADTRTTNNPLIAFTPRAFALRGAGPVPNDSSVNAVALDVTVLNNTSAGNLRVYPSDQANAPTIASANYAVPATAVENLVIAKLGSDGAVTFYSNQYASGDHVDVVIDVVGYYRTAPGLPGAPTGLTVSKANAGNGAGRNDQYLLSWQPPAGSTTSGTRAVSNGAPIGSYHVRGYACTAAAGPGTSCSLLPASQQPGPVTASGPATQTDVVTMPGASTDAHPQYYAFDVAADNTTPDASGTGTGAYSPVVEGQLPTYGPNGAPPLGLEAWDSYVTGDLGGLQTSHVNVATGNLVVTADDSTPVQAHGRLSFAVRRAYNSQGSGTDNAGNLGVGWRLSVGQTGDLLGDGVGADGLVVPSTETLTQPGNVTFIDNDGTRHTFIPAQMTGRVSLAPVAPATSLTGLLAALEGTALTPRAGGNVCVDQTYTSPPGVHVKLWRYLDVTSPGSSPCSPSGTTPVLLAGWGAERADGLRYQYASTGELLEVTDRAGNRLRYGYDQDPATALPTATPGSSNLGRLRYVYDPTSCTTSGSGSSLSFTNRCRVMSFTYSDDPNATCAAPTGAALGECVTDPAGRLTVYGFTAPYTSTSRLLSTVTNPDGSTITYQYGSSCAGSAAAAGQLCSASDLLGQVTSFDYDASAVPRVAAVVDRRGVRTALTYLTASTDADTEPTAPSCRGR